MLGAILSTQCGVTRKISFNETVTWGRMKPDPKASRSPCLPILYSTTNRPQDAPGSAMHDTRPQAPPLREGTIVSKGLMRDARKGPFSHDAL